MFTVMQVPDDCIRCDTDIGGLYFEPNYSRGMSLGDGSRYTMIYSNPGSVIGHFVTHAPDFRYSTFGIHLGQLDRLTFYSHSFKRLVGYFIDCRRCSPTAGRKVALEFATDVRRKLVIPPGVAHTFQNIEQVVTRNDLLLFAAPNCPTWNLLNDDVVFPWTDEGIRGAPLVDTNELEVPLAASMLFYKVQQACLRGKSGSRTLYGKAGAVEPLSDLQREVFLPPSSDPIAGCCFATNCFTGIANGSWMIIPNTESCLMDLTILELDETGAHFRLSKNQNVLHTFLDREGSSIELDLMDVRLDSPTCKRRTVYRFACDPRYHVRIPAGIAYRYRGTGRYALREERELLSECADGDADTTAMAVACDRIPADKLVGLEGVHAGTRVVVSSLQHQIAYQEFCLASAPDMNDEGSS